MSECVVRMEMPKNYCEMSVEINGVGDWYPIMAGVCDYNSTKKMPDWCPIICQLPEGHGRLVDADAMDKHVYNDIPISVFGSVKKMASVRQIIEDAPTIVPAAKEGE